MRWGLVLICCLLAATLCNFASAKRRKSTNRNRKRSSSFDLDKDYDSKDDYYDDYYYDDEYDYDDDEYDDYDDEYDNDDRKRVGKSNSRNRRQRQSTRGRSASRRNRNHRKFGRSGDFDSFMQNSVYDYGDDMYEDYTNNYDSRERTGKQRAGRGSRMRAAGRVMDSKPEPPTKIVPVVVNKKEKKKMKIITTQKGFYIPRGTQMFGKFTDLHSCQKACAISPTCFAGDFNPWTKKCYGHGNRTACASMSTHSQLTHFKKVFCSVVDTPRGLVTLGIMLFKGIKLHGVDDLAGCVKKCVNMAGGIAAKNVAATINSTPQICFGVDYNFASHECFAHIRHGATAPTYQQLCPDADDPIKTSHASYPNPSVVNILICPLAMA